MGFSWRGLRFRYWESQSGFRRSDSRGGITCEKKVLMTVGVTASETVAVESLVMAASVHSGL